MNIIGQIVSHISWGKGKIEKKSDNIIEVAFDIGVKKMQFPEGFKQFLTFANPEYQAYAEKMIDEKLQRDAEIKKKQAEATKNEVIIKTGQIHKKRREKKIEERYNIAFKCNYCDGGSDHNRIGFCNPCSDEMIYYHTSTHPHKWCMDEDCPCSRYFKGEISRKELDSSCDNGGFACYESQMLRDWKAFAGFVLQGANKGKPLKLAHVQPNSLAVLTTRFPNSNESKRAIFAVFLVDDAYEGDNKEEGYVTTTSKYKLSLSEKEAKELMFWQYYSNKNAPEDIAWGQGLHRYIDDIQSAQILRRIAEIKKGTADERLANDFYEYYCKINGIEQSEVLTPSGALTRK